MAEQTSNASTTTSTTTPASAAPPAATAPVDVITSHSEPLRANMIPQSAEDVQAIIDDMSHYYASGMTRDVNFRIEQLKKLESWLRAHEEDIFEALHADLGKAPFESYVTELGLVLDEIKMMLKHIKCWTKPQRVGTPLFLFPAHSKVYPTPYGVAAVLSPWNYPVQLALVPLVDAIAAGNCVALKPSRTSAHTSGLLKTMCEEIFDPRFVFCFHGANDINQWLLQVQFDYMFFTGSPRVGHEIMHTCADFLTPLTLELGGKSPCFIDKFANLEVAAARIAWGKCVNSGQTCVCPDYFLVHEDVVEPFVEQLKIHLHKYYGENIIESDEYPHMISAHHFQRVCGLIDNINPNAKVVEGGQRDPETLKIAPTIITGITLDDPVMGEEIFGPVMPILTWRKVDEALAVPKHFGHPLACYIFSEDKDFQDYILANQPFGGGCINDVVIHVSNNHMGFGGLGNSGMGEYHGKRGFDCFTHYRSVAEDPTCIDVPVRYPPFGKKLKLARFLMGG